MVDFFFRFKLDQAIRIVLSFLNILDIYKLDSPKLGEYLLNFFFISFFRNKINIDNA